MLSFILSCRIEVVYNVKLIIYSPVQSMQKFTTKSTTTSIYTTIYSKKFSTLSADISFLNKYLVCML